MEGFVRRSKGFIPMNLPNPKETFFMQRESNEEDQKLQV